MYTLAEINKDLQKENLPTISRQQREYLMNKNKPAKFKRKREYKRLIEGEHYKAVENGTKKTYLFFDAGVRFFYDWALKKKYG